jgi:hypothetical protein
MESISTPTGMIIDMHSAIWWITIANILYLASYTVHDILWLRILTVVAASLLIPYYALQPVPLVDAIAWNALFIAINIYWIIRLMIERRPVHLSPDEARLRVLSFPSLTPREARDLYALGSWDDVAAGTSLVSHDNTQGLFSVILRGVADVMHRGIKITELGEGQFVGGIDLQAASNVDIDVLVRLRVRVMCLPRRQLQAFLSNRPDVALALERSVGLELQRVLDVSLSKLDSR